MKTRQPTWVWLFFELFILNTIAKDELTKTSWLLSNVNTICIGYELLFTLDLDRNSSALKTGKSEGCIS